MTQKPRGVSGDSLPAALVELAEKINNHAVGWWSEHILHCDQEAMAHIKTKKHAEGL